MLQKLNWIDRQTRSIFIEFIIYNPNINMFSITTLLFEILPSGNLLKTTRFDVITLFTSLSNDSLEIGCG